MRDQLLSVVNPIVRTALKLRDEWATGTGPPFDAGRELLIGRFRELLLLVAPPTAKPGVSSYEIDLSAAAFSAPESRHLGVGYALANWVDEMFTLNSFPLRPAVPAEKRPEVLFNGMDWMARSLVPSVAYQRFGSEAEGNGERWSASNARLWMLLNELHARRAAIVRLLGQGIADGSDRPPMLAGTGPADADQAFVAGVVQQLIGLQNNVGWTPTALAEERDYRRMTAIGYAAALALVIAVGIFAYLTWLR